MSRVLSTWACQRNIFRSTHVRTISVVYTQLWFTLSTQYHQPHWGHVETLRAGHAAHVQTSQNHTLSRDNSSVRRSIYRYTPQGQAYLHRFGASIPIASVKYYRTHCIRLRSWCCCRFTTKTCFEDFAYYTAQLSMALWLPCWLGKLYLRLNWKYQRTHRLLRKLAEQIIEQEQNKKNESENERPKNLIASLVSSLNEQSNDEQTSSDLI